MPVEIGKTSIGGLPEVLDALPQSILVFDRSGTLHYMNNTAATLFDRYRFGERSHPSKGASHLDWLGLLEPLTKLDGSPLDPSELPWARLSRGESFRDYELRSALNSGGVRLILSFWGRRIETSTGDELLVLSIEDASHKHESELLFRTAFERGPVPVTLLRRSDQLLIDANAAFLELLGFDRSEVVGRRASELTDVLNLEEIEGAREQLRRGEEVERLEIVVRGRDGDPRTVLSWHRWVEVGGEECLLGVYLDVTEQKELDRKLQEATQRVLQSASIFSRNVMQQLERLRGPERGVSVGGELEQLTRREREVVIRVGAGHSNLRIAHELDLTPQTVRNYVTRIYRKIGVDNRAEAVVWARERGLVQG